jgi:CheY-like chemotaxis protein
VVTSDPDMVRQFLALRLPVAAVLIDARCLEASDRLVEACSAARVPIIVLTQGGIAASTTQWGGRTFSHVRAPMRPEELLAVLRRALGVEPPSLPIVVPETTDASATRPVRVLLAEDHPVNQHLVQRLLARRGHSVHVAADGRQAVEAFEREPFDLVLMDVQMPVMDGLEATAAIRRLESARGGHVLIVAMTAHAMAGDRERCLEAGMDDYLAKPIEPGALVALVGRVGADLIDSQGLPAA